MPLWQVAVEAPIREPLTYLATPELHSQLVPGMRVDVPLGKRQAKGVLLGRGTSNSDYELKTISGVDHEYAPLSSTYCKWIEWVARYYLYAPGLVYGLAFPPLKKQEKTRKSQRPLVVPASSQRPRHKLTQEQQQIVQDIQNQPGFAAHLIFGVTGSGKTEIYLDLLESTLARGQTGLFLVPEISLTPQMVHRFAARFGGLVGVLHSQLTDRERTNQWWDIVSGQKKILIGARSALFCPIQNLGLIVVDEEHETSFKQDEKLKYHGRDCAIVLAKMHDCPVVLGSATPSFESWQNAQAGRYRLHSLSQRVENRSLPEIEVVDLREDRAKSVTLPKWMSPRLYEVLCETLQAQKQSALFLNRRGVAQIILCESCGFIHECPNCDISLTLHQQNHLICHYCDYHENFKDDCPSCREGQMKPVGVGTEQIETDLLHLFPGSKVARADRDEIQNRLDLETFVKKVENREVDFLVGTQMIAKGLDFQHLQTVGLVLADIGFNLPDFRSPERSFQLMTQVAGRAGRHVRPGDPPGRVIIQTYNPDHNSLLYARQNKYAEFAALELETRKELHYPPYGRLVTLRIQSPHLERAHLACDTLKARAISLKNRNSAYSTIELLGPGSAPLSRLRNQFRFQMLLKGSEAHLLNKFCRQLLGNESWIPLKSRVIVDVDPLHLL